MPFRKMYAATPAFTGLIRRRGIRDLEGPVQPCVLNSGIPFPDVADRISLWDLDTKIEIHSSDEVGMLAESFHRMQESLKAAIERLRRKGSSG